MSTRVSLILDQGTTFFTTIEMVNQDGSPLDVTEMTARSQMRRAYTSANAIPFTIALSTGSLILSLTAVETAAIEAGRYVYDVELVDGSGHVTRLIEGIATVTPETTRG